MQTGDVIAVAVAEDVEVVLLNDVEAVDASGQLMSEKLPTPSGLKLASDTVVAEMS